MKRMINIIVDKHGGEGDAKVHVCKTNVHDGVAEPFLLGMGLLREVVALTRFRHGNVRTQKPKAKAKKPRSKKRSVPLKPKPEWDLQKLLVYSSELLKRFDMTACISMYILSLSQNQTATPNSTIPAPSEAPWPFNQGFRHYHFGVLIVSFVGSVRPLVCQKNATSSIHAFIHFSQSLLQKRGLPCQILPCQMHRLG